MEYMRLTHAQREDVLAALAGMPGYLQQSYGALSPSEARIPGHNGAFSPVEQVWHLADLELEGFGVRIRRLLAEAAPHLPDFDGARIAAERDYRSRALAAGLAAFAAARAENIAALRGIDAQSWLRTGTQAGVGTVSLCDMPSFMLQHDAAHRSEIEAWCARAAEAQKDRPTG